MTESEIQQWRESRMLYPQTTFQALRGPDAGDCIRAAVCTLLQIDPAKLTNWMTLEHDGWSLVMERELAALGWRGAASRDWLGEIASACFNPRPPT